MEYTPFGDENEIGETVHDRVRYITVNGSATKATSPRFRTDTVRPRYGGE